MPVLHKLLMMIYLAALAGCAIRREGAIESGTTYEEPNFVVSLSQKWVPKVRPQIDILEDSKGVSIRLYWQNDHRIADMGRYLRLKKRILTSVQWSNRDPAATIPIVTTGPPRDRLSIYMGDEHMYLYDSDVPEAWKREINRLADDVESKTTHKKDGPGK